MMNTLNLVFCLSLGIIVESELLYSKKGLYARLDDCIKFKCCGQNGTQYAFSWYRDGVPIKPSAQYKISREEECSVLYITKITADDFNVKSWMANVSACPDGCAIFPRIIERLSIDSITTDRNETSKGSISRTEGETLTLICLMRGEESRNVTNYVSWEYKSEKSGAHYEPFYTGVTTTNILNDSIKFDKLTKHQRGYYQCVLKEHNFTLSKNTLLRVRDKYAALWPFLGIIIEVVVLIIVIFACEKRQSKKKKTYDDDQAGQTDTLMKNETEKANAAESEIKKRPGRH